MRFYLFPGSEAYLGVYVDDDIIALPVRHV